MLVASCQFACSYSSASCRLRDIHCLYTVECECLSAKHSEINIKQTAFENIFEKQSGIRYDPNDL